MAATNVLLRVLPKATVPSRLTAPVARRTDGNLFTPLPVKTSALKAFVEPTLLLKIICPVPAFTVKLFVPLIVGPNVTSELLVVIVVFALSVNPAPTYV